MSKWEMVRLGDYIFQIRGVSYTPKDVSDTPTGRHVAILRAHNIQEEGLLFDDLVYVNKSKIKDFQYLKKGDIVICASSGSKNLVGKAAQTQHDLDISFGAFCKVIRTEKIYPSYLGNFFKGKKYRRVISELSAGANINNLRNEHIENLEIPLPPLEIQKQIAKTLDIASEILAMRKQELAELDNLVKAVFYDMFGDPVTNVKKWEIAQLGDLSVDIKYGTSTPPKFSDKGYCFIRATNIKSGRIIDDNMKFISEDEAEKICKCKLIGGELIIVRSGVNTGDTCVITDQYSGHYAGYDLIISIKHSSLNSIFLNELINTNYMDKIIKPLTRRAAQPHLNADQVRNLPIILPPLSLQTQFAEIVTKIEEQKALVHKAIDETQYLFDSLMNEYFSQ